MSNRKGWSTLLILSPRRKVTKRRPPNSRRLTREEDSDHIPRERRAATDESFGEAITALALCYRQSFLGGLNERGGVSLLAARRADGTGDREGRRSKRE